MNISVSVLFLAAFSACALSVTAQEHPPRVFLIDGARLAVLKKKLAAQDETRLAARLREQADKYLDMRPVSVMDKPTIPPGGDKHDYMSQAPYFWYDSSKPNGLPYMNRDGQRNPEIYKITDRSYIGELENASHELALAWYLTGEEKYAAKATTLLKHWFFDDSTRMNPNLNYAQAVPGVNNGRGIGIIESIALMGIVDAAGLLQGSRSWTGSDERALREWYAQYLEWMLTSPNGKDEHATRNNHGTWYLAQAVDFSLFAGNLPQARTLAEEGRSRMDGQVEKDGKMPLELARTNGLGYSTYNLTAWFRLATLADQTGTDLWNYQDKQGGSIRTALDWLRPYALGEKKWDYQQIGPYNKNDYYRLLLQAGAVYKDPQYFEYVGKGRKEGDDNLTDLLYLLYHQ